LEWEVRIAARAETIFPFFIDPAKLTRWFGLHATLHPEPGGVFRVDIDGHDIARGEYLAVEPPHRVVFSWGWENPDGPIRPGSTTVEVTLVPDGDTTIVRLRHLGLPASHRRETHEGWTHYLPRLIEAAQGGDPGPDIPLGLRRH